METTESCVFTSCISHMAHECIRILHDQAKVKNVDLMYVSSFMSCVQLLSKKDGVSLNEIDSGSVTYWRKGLEVRLQ